MCFYPNAVTFLELMDLESFYTKYKVFIAFMDAELSRKLQ